MTIKFIVDHPALFISDKKILVIADLHLGLEYELYKNGIVISPQAKKFQKILDNLIEMTRAKTLIILGDIKHEVPGISYREEKEIPKLFNHLIKKVQVICCKGNHDTHLRELLPKKVKIYSSRGFKLGKYGFFHGHAWPSKKLMQCDYLFMGHVHCAVEFRDKLGYRFLEHVWIKGKLNEKFVKKKYKIKKTGKLQTIILPTFNKLLGGVAVNTTTDKELIGPLLANKLLDIEKSKAYLLDGTFLGEIKRLTTLA
jgi:putative SbcD/Mre11-related phosphoesterase